MKIRRKSRSKREKLAKSAMAKQPVANININKIYPLLRKFNLAGMVKTVELRLAEAQEKDLSFSEFLTILLEDEKVNREDNRKQRLFKEARLPFEKHLDEFDFSFQPSIKKGEVLELSTCKYLSKGENIVFVGQPGTGKTHLSVALGLKALGYGYTVLFTPVWEMITNLQQSRADNSYQRKIEFYVKPDLLILDELGYRSLGETTVEDFFEIISRRYNHKSTIITSNRDFPSWDKIFFDKTLTGAIIDRIIHHCHVFLITGESYRFKDRQQNSRNARK
jgi:DNA replication protein DnaC